MRKDKIFLFIMALVLSVVSTGIGATPEELLGAAYDKNVFVCGDYFGGKDIGGKAAIAGDTEFDGFNIAYQNPGGDALVVGDDLAANNGVVHGNAVYGDTANVSPSVDFQAGGSAFQGSPIDFDQECADLGATSWGLAGNDGVGEEIVEPWGGIFLNGSDPLRNIFHLTEWEINGASYLEINVPEGSTVLITLWGSQFDFSNFAMILKGVDPEHVLWNAPEAQGIVIYSMTFQGSLLAPCACVNFNNGNFDGTLIAGELKGNGEFHHHLFEGDLEEADDCPVDDDDQDDDDQDDDDQDDDDQDDDDQDDDDNEDDDDAIDDDDDDSIDDDDDNDDDDDEVPPPPALTCGA